MRAHIFPCIWNMLISVIMEHSLPCLRSTHISMHMRHKYDHIYGTYLFQCIRGILISMCIGHTYSVQCFVLFCFKPNVTLEFNRGTCILYFRKRISIVPVNMEGCSRSVVLKVPVMAAILFLAVQTGDFLIYLNFLVKTFIQ
jgi:hypothetical protein